MSKRPMWCTFFMQMARQVSQMSTCASDRKVGCVFVKDKRVVATSFNGVPLKYPHPKSCVRKEFGLESGHGLNHCVCAHAESNAIANAAYHGVALEGCNVCVTTKPCAGCAGVLVNAGISEVYYEQEYDSPKTEEIFKYAGVKIQPITRQNTWI